MVDPTAVHELAEVQETPDKNLLGSLVGFRVVWIDHFFPFHRSASVRSALACFSYPPTAVQPPATVQEALLSSLKLAPLGFRVCSIDHFFPFQRSASVTGGLPLACQDPTAVQAPRDVHDTPARPADVEPAGLGVFSIDHLLPFQCSARVTIVLPL